MAYLVAISNEAYRLEGNQGLRICHRLLPVEVLYVRLIHHTNRPLLEQESQKVTNEIRTGPISHPVTDGTGSRYHSLAQRVTEPGPPSHSRSAGLVIYAACSVPKQPTSFRGWKPPILGGVKAQNTRV